MKDECVRPPKPQSQLAQLHDDDEDVFATNLIDRYGARPVSLQNMCLATFAVTYDEIQSTTEKEETNGGNDEEEEMQNTENDNSVIRIKLQKGLGIIRKRKQEAILHRRRYKIHTEPEKYYHAKLLLYSWNNGDDIISPFASYHDSYISKQVIIHQNAKDSMKTVWHLMWTCKIWKTIYHSLHGRWLLQIWHRMTDQHLCKVSPHCRMSNKKKKVL